jgi:hypothetical protein
MKKKSVIKPIAVTPRLHLLSGETCDRCDFFCRDGLIKIFNGAIPSYRSKRALKFKLEAYTREMPQTHCVCLTRLSDGATWRWAYKWVVNQPLMQQMSDFLNRTFGDMIIPEQYITLWVKLVPVK